MTRRGGPGAERGALPRPSRLPESLDQRRARARKILGLLERAHPDATIALRFGSPLDLLVATILAAQCTDERVNQVTETLFRTYRTAADYARADPAVFEREIVSTGFFRAKTRSVLAMARALLERHAGEVPRTLEALTALPGVGRKTANVVLGNAFGIPGIAVDTHVFRVTQRLGLGRSDAPDALEAQLGEVIPRPRWTRFCHLIQAHGRRVCGARAPACPTCPVRALCPWPGKTAPRPAAGSRPPPPAGVRPPGRRRRG
jgi:endonuclease-3